MPGHNKKKKYGKYVQRVGTLVIRRHCTPIRKVRAGGSMTITGGDTELRIYKNKTLMEKGFNSIKDAIKRAEELNTEL